MGDKTKGWIRKYIVRRSDDTDQPGGKHDGCDLFVMDLTHDPLAIIPMLEYAYNANIAGYKPLAREIVQKVTASPKCNIERIPGKLEWFIGELEKETP